MKSFNRESATPTEIAKSRRPVMRKVTPAVVKVATTRQLIVLKNVRLWVSNLTLYKK
jgi:hypothetical protein